MPRLLLLALLLLVPVSAEAQLRFMGGVGLSTPVGDLGDVAELGWNGMGGVQVGFPAFPVALRGDGTYYSFGEASGAPDFSMLGGAASLVFSLPGVGLVPYLLAGVGVYRTSAEGFDAVSDPGFHGAFGVDVGAIGFGGFAELRFVNVNGEASDSRFFTATIGVRL